MCLTQRHQFAPRSADRRLSRAHRGKETDWLFATPDREEHRPGRRRDDYQVNSLVYETADATAANSADSANSREPQLF